MKQLFKSMWVMAAAAMAFTACSKDETEDIMPQEEKVTITINADNEVAAPESRTNYDGTQQIKWNTTGEELEVLQVGGGNTITAEKTTQCTTDGTTATFDVQFTKAQAGDQFTYYAIYPAVNYESNNTNVTDFKLVLPDAQNAVKTSFDPNADLLVAVAQGPMEQPQSLNFQFRRPIAFAELTVKGINAGEKILNVTFDNKIADLAGRMKFDMTTGVAGEIGYSNTGKKSITINYTDYVAEGADKIYFTTFPATLQDFTITVKTDKAIYTKEVTIADASRHIALKSNTMTRFAVNNLIREEAKQTIKPGNYVIIAEKGGKYYGMSSENYDNKGERLVPAVLEGFSSDLLSYLPANENLIWTISGDDAQGYILKQGALYLVSNAKKLFTDTTQKNAPTAFTLSAGETPGTHKLTDGSSSRMIALHNNASYFSMYATGQVDNLYIVPAKEDTRPLLATPTVQAVADQNNVTVSWNKIEGAGSYTVTCGATTYTTQTPEELQYTFNDLAWETTHKFEVVAKPAVEADYKPSLAGTAEVTLGAAPKPAEVFDGEYAVLVKKSTGEYLALDTAMAKFNLRASEVTYNGETEIDIEQSRRWILTWNNGTYTLKSKEGKFLTMNVSGTHKNVVLSETATKFEITPSTNGHIISVFGTNEKLTLNEQYNDFNFDGNGTEVYLVRAKIDLTPAFNLDKTELTFIDSETAAAEAQTINVTITNNPQNQDITTEGATSFTVVAANDKLTITPKQKATADITETLTVKLGATTKTVTLNQKKYVAGQGGTMTIDLTNKSYSNGKEVTTVVGTDPLSVVFAGAKFYDKGNSVRMYAGNKLTISGKIITKVVLTITTTNKDGKKDLKCGADVINAKNNWTWENATGVDSVVFTGTANHTGVQKITVTYK